MKTKKSISRTVMAIAFMANVILILAGCVNSNDNPIHNKEEASGSQTTVKAPGMDIHTATVLGDLEVIQQHINAGSDLDEREPTLRSTPLISAAVFGKTEVARALIEAGADVNLQNDEGSTALHSAAFLCRTEIVKMLLENGAEKDLVNIYGSTPLASVAAPFEDVKAIYDEFSKNLGPLGFRLDYEQVRKARPVITEMLR